MTRRWTDDAVGAAVTRAAVVLHGQLEQVSEGLALLDEVAPAGVEPVVVAGDAEARGQESDVAIVLGGDGTMPRR